MYEERGTGRTTKQIKNLPLKAVFIWCNDHLHYPKSLAKKLGREDVEILGVSVLDKPGLKGREVSGMVLDHATELSEKRWEAYNMLRVCIRA